MPVFERMLRVGGYLNLAIAAAHLLLPLVVKPIGPLGVPPRAESWTGRVLLYPLAAGIAAFAALLGLYGLSGGGNIRRLPFLRTVLLLTGAIFLGRPHSHGLAAGGPRGLAEPGLPIGRAVRTARHRTAIHRGAVRLWNELRPPGRETVERPERDDGDAGPLRSVIAPYRKPVGHQLGHFDRTAVRRQLADIGIGGPKATSRS
jgi:hypothetical protein